MNINHFHQKHIYIQDTFQKTAHIKLKGRGQTEDNISPHFSAADQLPVDVI